MQSPNRARVSTVFYNVYTHCCISVLSFSIHIHDDLNQYFYHAVGSVATNSQSSPYVMWHISALGEHQIKRKVLCQDFTEMIFPSFFRDLTF